MIKVNNELYVTRQEVVEQIRVMYNEVNKNKYKQYTINWVEGFLNGWALSLGERIQNER